MKIIFAMQSARSTRLSVICLLDTWFDLFWWIVLTWNIIVFNVPDVNSAYLIIMTAIFFWYYLQSFQFHWHNALLLHWICSCTGLRAHLTFCRIWLYLQIDWTLFDTLICNFICNRINDSCNRSKFVGITLTSVHISSSQITWLSNHVLSCIVTWSVGDFSHCSKNRFVFRANWRTACYHSTSSPKTVLIFALWAHVGAQDWWL